LEKDEKHGGEAIIVTTGLPGQNTGKSQFFHETLVRPLVNGLAQSDGT
jgi:hypothetical protein